MKLCGIPDCGIMVTGEDVITGAGIDVITGAGLDAITGGNDVIRGAGGGGGGDALP